MNQKTKQKKTLLSETHVWAFFLRIHHIYIYIYTLNLAVMQLNENEV